MAPVDDVRICELIEFLCEAIPAVAVVGPKLEDIESLREASLNKVENEHVDSRLVLECFRLLDDFLYCVVMNTATLLSLFFRVDLSKYDSKLGAFLYNLSSNTRDLWGSCCIHSFVGAVIFRAFKS